MPRLTDGPSTPLFASVKIPGNIRPSGLVRSPAVSQQMRDAAAYAPTGACVTRGLPFDIGRVVLLDREPVSLKLDPLKAPWLVFLHTSDIRDLQADSRGFPGTNAGAGRLGEHAANYIVTYADGSEETIPIRRRHELAAFQGIWGERPFAAVHHLKPHPFRLHTEQMHFSWGQTQTRVNTGEGAWRNWLFAWENPHPRKAIVGLRLEPVTGVVLLFGVSAGKASSNPLLWERRQKALLRLPKGEEFDPTLVDRGLLRQVQLDLGQVISASLRPLYPNERWSRTYNNRLPDIAEREIIVEYTAHSDARFHLSGGKTVPVARLTPGAAPRPLAHIPAAAQRVTIRVLDKASRKPVPVKLHLHGEAGEYLAPVDRHRQPNPGWYEDFSVDFAHANLHYCT
jgi:hypothetical protein